MKDHIHKAFNDSSSALIQAVMYKKTGEGGTKKGAAIMSSTSLAALSPSIYVRIWHTLLTCVRSG